MITWEDQPAGTYLLKQWVRPGRNGETVELGIFQTKRALIDAARAIAKVSKLEGGFGGSFKRSDKREGCMVDGFSFDVHIDPPPHDPHVEVTLSDGRTLFLEDLERELGASHVFDFDMIYAITTNGRGGIYLENELGTVAARTVSDKDDPEEFANVVRELCLEAEFKDA